MAICKHRVMDKCKKNGKPCCWGKDCFEPEEPKPMTNADRIRAMTDEELALFLAEKYANASVLRLQDGGHEPTATEIKVLTNTLRKTWMRWLKQPAEVE